MNSVVDDFDLNSTVCLFMIMTVSLSVVFSQNESAGIAASIDAMAAGEDVPEMASNGSKNAADDSPSVR